MNTPIALLKSGVQGLERYPMFPWQQGDTRHLVCKRLLVTQKQDVSKSQHCETLLFLNPEYQDFSILRRV